MIIVHSLVVHVEAFESCSTSCTTNALQLLLLLLLQDLMVVAVSLARLRYYDAQLMHAAANRSAAAVQAYALPLSASAAAAAGMVGSRSADDSSAAPVQAIGRQQQLQLPSKQGQQQQGKHQQRSDTVNSAADSLAGITQQLLVNYLWANASLAQSSQQLLLAALQALLAVPQGSGSPSNPSFLQALNPRLAPLCSWSLATMLVCLLAKRARVQGCDMTQEPAQQHGAVISTNSSRRGSKRTAAAADCDRTAQDAAVCQLAHAVAAVHGDLECKAAAAAGSDGRSRGAGSKSSSSASGPISSSSSSSGLSAVRFDQEGLAQLHHAHLLVTAAVNAACRATPADVTAPTHTAAVADQQATEQLASPSAASAAAAAVHCSDEQLAAFREQCREAWQQSRQGRQATSYLQLQVCEVSANRFQSSSRYSITMTCCM
jgi:hypothetical protein